MIWITVEPADVTVGQQVRGHVEWQADKTPQALDIRLRWVTAGRGTTDSGVAASHTAGPDQPGGLPPAVPFAFTVPVEGPCTYDGRLLRIRWEVHARLRLPWSRDEQEAAVLVVRPLLAAG